MYPMKPEENQFRHIQTNVGVQEWLAVEMCEKSSTVFVQTLLSSSSERCSIASWTRLWVVGTCWNPLEPPTVGREMKRVAKSAWLSSRIPGSMWRQKVNQQIAYIGAFTLVATSLWQPLEDHQLSISEVNSTDLLKITNNDVGTAISHHWPEMPYIHCSSCLLQPLVELQQNQHWSTPYDVQKQSWSSSQSMRRGWCDRVWYRYWYTVLETWEWVKILIVMGGKIMENPQQSLVLTSNYYIVLWGVPFKFPINQSSEIGFHQH